MESNNLNYSFDIADSEIVSKRKKNMALKPKKKIKHLFFSLTFDSNKSSIPFPANTIYAMHSYLYFM